MAGASESADNRKRGPVDAETPLSGDAPLAKRACAERPTHLTILEEFYDLEGEDADCGLDSSATGSCAQDYLVAEMMRSLERVIEEGVVRGFGEVSTSQPAALLNVGSPALAGGSDPGLTWADDGSISLSGYAVSRTVSVAENGQGSLLQADERTQLLPSSDDQLGGPSLTSFDTIDDNVSFEGDWASLMEGSEVLFSMTSVDWLDAPLAHCEDARDVFEPIVLF